MDPLTMGMITGGANLIGSLFSSSTNASNTQAQIAAQEMMQQQTQEFNAQQAQINRDYQTTMSNTAYQRASQDMTKAGLNPMMMFGSGSAASSPGGGAAAVGTPGVPMGTKTSPLANLGDIIPKIVSTAGSVKGLEKQEAEVDKAKQDAVTAGNIASKTGLELPEARRKAQEEEAKLADPAALGRGAQTEQKFGSWASPFVKPYQSTIGTLNDLVDKAIEKATGQSARIVAGKPNPWSSDQPRNFDERYGHW